MDGGQRSTFQTPPHRGAPLLSLGAISFDDDNNKENGVESINAKQSVWLQRGAVQCPFPPLSHHAMVAWERRWAASLSNASNAAIANRSKYVGVSAPNGHQPSAHPKWPPAAVVSNRRLGFCCNASYGITVALAIGSSRAFKKMVGTRILCNLGAQLCSA